MSRAPRLLARLVVAAALALLLLTAVSTAPATARVLLRDDFDGAALDLDRWTVPTGDASFFGRTQIRPAAALPPPSDGVLRLVLDTHNPTALVPGDSFWGSEIDTVDRYSVGDGLVFEARVRLVTPVPAGLVGAVFSFWFDAATGTRDELDVELLSSDLVAGRRRVLTNAFDDADFSQPGAKSFASLPGADLDAFHIYQIRWLPDRVEWRIDGMLVRTETGTVPDTPMSIRLNLWAPDANFAEAFDASLQPVATTAANTRFAYELDWVEIRAPETSAVLSFDGTQQLVNKDVGVADATERWAIGRHVAAGTVTGNVFSPAGDAPRFVWCTDTGAPSGPTTIALACWGADRCVSAPCGLEQWTFLSAIELDEVFFAPSHDVAWLLLPAPVILPRAFFSAPSDAAADAGVQQCRDGACTLISKDVDAERWAITRDLGTGTVTGNVLFTDGRAPAFLWCEETDATSTTVTLTCRLATNDRS